MLKVLDCGVNDGKMAGYFISENHVLVPTIPVDLARAAQQTDSGALRDRRALPDSESCGELLLLENSFAGKGLQTLNGMRLQRPLSLLMNSLADISSRNWNADG